MKKTATKTSMILSATALLTVMTLTSCKKESELDTIKDAQMCLNDATPSQAQGCVSKLAAINTPQANQLKCAAYFIEEGYGTPTKLIDAIEASEASNGNSGSINMISQLSFNDDTNAAEAFEVCSSSGISVYSQLSSLVQIATLAKSFGNLNLGANPTPQDFQDALVNDVPPAALGALVNTAYASSCTGSSSSGEALAEYCGELGDALAGSNETEIGNCLKVKLAGSDPGNICPLF